MESPLIWYRDGKGTPMVPCDDAAIERAATEILRLTRERGTGPDRWSAHETAEIVLRAAGAL